MTGAGLTGGLDMRLPIRGLLVLLALMLAGRAEAQQPSTGAAPFFLQAVQHRQAKRGYGIIRRGHARDDAALPQPPTRSPSGPPSVESQSRLGVSRDGREAVGPARAD